MERLKPLILILLMACDNPEQQFNVQITESYVTDAVASGSGIAVEKDSAFIIGDDINYLAVLNINNRGTQAIPFDDDSDAERIPKLSKHDFESCTLAEINDQQYLLAFGSGGISPMRDSLIGLNRTNAGQNFTISLNRLYADISKKSGLRPGELNIEGSTLSGNELLLFNRGVNFIAVIPWAAMVEYILQPETGNIPPFKILTVQLPVVEGFQVGFSGACTIDENEILFTASLEETTDYIQDGTVKGSYVGTLKLGNDSALVSNLIQLKDEKGNVVLDKLESIDIVSRTSSLINAIAVADNDDGASKIFRLRISYP